MEDPPAAERTCHWVRGLGEELGGEGSGEEGAVDEEDPVAVAEIHW